MKKLILFIILFLIVPLHSKELKFTDLYGKWILKYKNGYGYEFRFKKNYNVYVILYLKKKASVFKGIYTIEKENTIRININALKNESFFSNIERKKGFKSASSSYFIFNVTPMIEKGKKFLEIRPKNIVIDGTASSGYFEQIIQLSKI